jgi:hypothetical protein
VSLRIKGMVGKSTDKLLIQIKDFNPRLHTKHWRMMDRQLKLKGQCLRLGTPQKSSEREAAQFSQNSL